MSSSILVVSNSSGGGGGGRGGGGGGGGSHHSSHQASKMMHPRPHHHHPNNSRGSVIHSSHDHHQHHSSERASTHHQASSSSRSFHPQDVYRNASNPFNGNNHNNNSSSSGGGGGTDSNTFRAVTFSSSSNNNNSNPLTLYYSTGQKNPSSQNIHFSRIKNGLEHTPKDSREKESFRYYCPICMMYFKFIFKVDCCSQYICKYCMEELLENIHSKSSRDCPYCLQSNVKFKQVESDEKVRDYNDEPIQHSTPCRILKFTGMENKVSPFPLKSYLRKTKSESQLIIFDNLFTLSNDDVETNSHAEESCNIERKLSFPSQYCSSNGDDEIQEEHNPSKQQENPLVSTRETRSTHFIKVKKRQTKSAPSTLYSKSHQRKQQPVSAMDHSIKKDESVGSDQAKNAELPEQ
ncbi:hypothetical protein FDP41_007091 [Naegleria fowleri]|uniref:RING-type domain-containing protein n=1 Tax=Naegleria fowleri TaxID=5763 RepID=A0A6A5BI15_NAEFO|nr:uncharacterized protein FDP41_007091 [Naegleria fowleri]KAF0973704.1 hypothetical protein FDP41_007091 [Naegleria fowleri]